MMRVSSVLLCGTTTLTSTVAPVHPNTLRFTLCPATSTTTHSATTAIAPLPKPFLSSSTPSKPTNRAVQALVSTPRVSLQRHCKFTESEELVHDYDDDDFVVVNFYHFLFFEDPKAEVAKHLSFMEGLDIYGRIYVNEQGINAQYSGPSKDALAYVEWLKEDDRFSDILVQVSPALNGHAFPKLKLRYKPSLVQFEGGDAHLPLLDPLMRATPLEPSKWRKKLEAANPVDDPSKENSSSNYILLDVRNGYEWDIGHFDGAQRPDVDCFRSTSYGLSESEVPASDPLADVDKEKTDILMYCTGGIRCDVYSTILRQRGFQNLYTLEGGIAHYLKREGPVKWTGNLFVFDSRLSLSPSTYKPEALTKAIKTEKNFSHNNAFAKCYVCGSQVCELRHRNCANIDCNLLFLCCTECVTDLRGCCCVNCTTAPRLRPVLRGHQRYKKWHIYRDSDSELLSNSTA
ncbi:rhodanese-like domain-containing protein 8, chloroplastic [Humulus lupulus]|uniref:rhodanese-like domain-containing protein 8, chloroplastic n=1 Tax=Humulus lupulus TaxID=3486 RepID=UPI002B403B6E|nr:rhodanese-like domain-containing protein 8, chloroplastic [Humulus lupulus]